MVSSNTQHVNDDTLRNKAGLYGRRKRIKKIIKGLVCGCLIVVAGGAVYGINQAYKYEKDIERRSVELPKYALTSSAEYLDIYTESLTNNRKRINYTDDRNKDVACSLLGDINNSVDSTEEILTKVRAMRVAAGRPNKEFKGYIKEEHAQDEIVNGIDNLLGRYNAFREFYGKPTDFTAEQFYLIETQCEKWGLDPYFMLGLYMTESTGKSNAQNPVSTARGYGQVLIGTGKYLYENWLGNEAGTYTHDLAFDPETNIEMTTTYLGKLANQYGLYRAVQIYRGKSDISEYLSYINKYMNWAGKSITWGDGVIEIH